MTIGEAMNEQHRTSKQEDPTDRSDRSVEAGNIVDTDDDTEAHGGKIFVRNETRLDDSAERGSQPTT